MIYFPITLRLQRLYASTECATPKRWHVQNRTNTRVICHPSNEIAWKHFDSVYPDFATDPGNVRFGLYVTPSTSSHICTNNKRNKKSGLIKSL